MRKKYQSYRILSARIVSATGPWTLTPPPPPLKEFLDPPIHPSQTCGQDPSTRAVNSIEAASAAASANLKKQTKTKTKTKNALCVYIKSSIKVHFTYRMDLQS